MHKMLENLISFVIAGFSLISLATAEEVRGEFKGVPIPANVHIQEPTNSVPEGCAAYSGVWRTTASDGREGLFFVEEVRPDCSAKVVYAWGPLPGSSIETKGGWSREDGRITQKGLEWTLPRYKARGVYKLETIEQMKGVFYNKHNIPIHLAYDRTEIPTLLAEEQR